MCKISNTLNFFFLAEMSYNFSSLSSAGLYLSGPHSEQG